jgi:hypothetical protein
VHGPPPHSAGTFDTSSLASMNSASSSALHNANAARAVRPRCGRCLGITKIEARHTAMLRAERPPWQPLPRAGRALIEALLLTRLLLLLSLPEEIIQGRIDLPFINVAPDRPVGVVIQYRPFSLETSTPFMVALSRPFPDGANERSAKRQGRLFVTSISSCSSPLPLPASLPVTA